MKATTSNNIRLNLNRIYLIFITVLIVFMIACNTDSNEAIGEVFNLSYKNDAGVVKHRVELAVR